MKKIKIDEQLSKIEEQQFPLQLDPGCSGGCCDTGEVDPPEGGSSGGGGGCCCCPPLELCPGI